VTGLILVCCRLGGGPTLGKGFAPLFRLAYSADWAFWVFKKCMPMAYARVMGLPKGDELSPHESGSMAGRRELLFPFKPRREGAIFRRVRLEPRRGAVPIRAADDPDAGRPHARDDHLAPLPIRRRGGVPHPGRQACDDRRRWPHLHGHDNEVREAIQAFVQAST